MPNLDIPEGFYWVRVTAENDDGKPERMEIVAQRWGGAWLFPGFSEWRDGRAIEVISERIAAPSERLDKSRKRA